MVYQLYLKLEGLLRKNKFGNMENNSYLYIDIEILADRHELELDILNEINLVDSN